MADNDPNETGSEGQPAAISSISLSQALLGTMDAILKAQVHAARSFLNLLLQIGYPHEPVDEHGVPKIQDGKPYNQEFYFDVEVEGEKKPHKVSIPTLALMPVSPLAVESAVFKLEMRVDYVAEHEQMQAAEAKQIGQEKEAGFDSTKRPWFLVAEPISIRGNIAAPAGEAGKESVSGDLLSR